MSLHPGYCNAYGYFVALVIRADDVCLTELLRTVFMDSHLASHCLLPL